MDEYRLEVGLDVRGHRPGCRQPAGEPSPAVYDDNQLLGPWLVSGEVYRALVPQQQWGDMVALVKAAPGADLEQLRHGLEKVTDPYYIVNVDNRSEFKGSVAAQVNGLLGLLYGLLGLAIVIAILGIINTLALSVVERRREIGMLRAVGMQRKQVRRTIYLESLLIAVFGALLGLVLGHRVRVAVHQVAAQPGARRAQRPVGPGSAVPGARGGRRACWPRCGRESGRRGHRRWPPSSRR